MFRWLVLGMVGGLALASPVHAQGGLDRTCQAAHNAQRSYTYENVQEVFDHFNGLSLEKMSKLPDHDLVLEDLMALNSQRSDPVRGPELLKTFIDDNCRTESAEAK